MQKKNYFFFSFPSESNFGEAKVTKKRANRQTIRPPFFLFPLQDILFSDNRTNGGTLVAHEVNQILVII